MCFSWEQFHALWWQSCRHLLSERYPESSGALEPSTGLKVRGRRAHVRKTTPSVGLIGIFGVRTVIWPLPGLRKELQPKSVIFTTMRLSTTQLVDLRRPCTWMSLECRYDMPCRQDLYTVRVRERRHGGDLLKSSSETSISWLGCHPTTKVW